MWLPLIEIPVIWLKRKSTGLIFRVPACEPGVGREWGGDGSDKSHSGRWLREVGACTCEYACVCACRKTGSAPFTERAVRQCLHHLLTGWPLTGLDPALQVVEEAKMVGSLWSSEEIKPCDTVFIPSVQSARHSASPGTA